MKSLNDLLKSITIQEIKGDSNRQIENLAFDSRKVRPNGLFVAMRGTQTDGHNYIDKVIEAGCKVIVCEELPSNCLADVCYIRVADSNNALGCLASAFYDEPSKQMHVVGVTGTNGKTTTASLLYHLFRHLGYKVGLLSTVANYVDDKVYSTNLTTPDALTIQSLMAEMIQEGCSYCFMEVSSHALIQQRVAGIQFKGAIFSNLTHDHLDFHASFSDYLYAKKRLFDGLSKDAFALVNRDDRNGMVMVQNTAANVKTYALRSMADFRARVMECTVEGMQLRIENKDIWMNFIGNFNAYNLLAVYGTAILLGAAEEDVLRAMSLLHPVSGRLEFLRSKSGITAAVDYAHTPDALENVLECLRELVPAGNKLITVVGCGGDRDKKKRPEMASIAERLSDRVILTSDNPRSEEPSAILADMLAGLTEAGKRKTLTIVNRREGIRAACMMASKGDMLLVAGKGHETYQIIKGERTHFDDREVLQECLLDADAALQ